MESFGRMESYPWFVQGTNSIEFDYPKGIFQHENSVVFRILVLVEQVQGTFEPKYQNMHCLFKVIF